MCNECKSYQDFRRYFSISSTILSLLIALLSVGGIVVPIISAPFQPAPQSSPDIVSASWINNGEYVSVVIFNAGDIDDFLVEIYLEAAGELVVKQLALDKRIAAKDTINKKILIDSGIRDNLSLVADCTVKAVFHLEKQTSVKALPCKPEN